MANSTHRLSVTRLNSVSLTNTTVTDLYTVGKANTPVTSVLACNVEATDPVVISTYLAPKGVAHNVVHTVDVRTIAAGDSAEIPLDLILDDTDKLRVKATGGAAVLTLLGPKV